MGFRCFNGTNNCDYCGSCHSEFKARTSDEKRCIYNQALDDVDNIITEQLDKSDNQIECSTLRWVLDVLSDLIQ